MIVIHSGSTNYDIVNYISRYWNISSMVSKNIRNSRLDGMNMDLSQYIVEQLMRMDNTRLLGLYHSGKLLSFIHRMILNQRNYYRSFYNLSKVNNNIMDIEQIINMSNNEISFHSINEPMIDEVDIAVDMVDERYERESSEHEKIKKIIGILRNDTFGYSGRTQKEMEHDLSIAILSCWMGVDINGDEILFKKRMSMREMGETFVRPLKNGNFKRMERRLINKYVKKGIEIVRKESNNNI